ncbi:MAG: GMC family oxidoreductase, partial [Planctomycetota bacterium]|nr:GMC family oxidoreductase [Planctomycetota bacterium]
TGTRSTPLETATRTNIRSQVQSLELSEIQLYSAHQMSTCRMSTNHRRGVADPSGKVFETQSIYVADSSLLPSAPGVNPMITVMGMARHVGKQLAETKKPAS